MIRRVVAPVLFCFLLVPVAGFSQVDPGVRGSPIDAGNALGSVALNNPVTILDFFNDGKARFMEVDSVSDGSVPGENGAGLGPRYNSRSCAAWRAAA